MTNYPRKPNSGKQAGRKNLPGWLRHAVDDILRAEYAIGMGDPSLAVPRGADVPDSVINLVADAAPELRHACRKNLLGHALAPHAKWEAEDLDDTVVTVADLERQLRELAESGDRGAILALLAALDPARYGPPGKTVPPPDSSVDTVDFAPAILK
jgi:hypothetical protein